MPLAAFFRALTRRLPRALAITIFAAISLSAHAEVRLPAVFTDHAVLQRDRPVPLWGEAAPGENVSVTFGAQTLSATADASGRWQIALAALPASATPADLSVRGATNEIVLRDLLVGEVWLCSGQSNMEKPLGDQRGQKPVFDSEKEIAAANFPHIRLLKIAKSRAPAPGKDITGAWTVCSPETVDKIKFSAAGYFFGRRLHQELGVPIGLIDATWGGTRIEPWTAPEAFAAFSSLSALATAALTPGAKAEETIPSQLYYGMILPLAPYAFRGAIWYQGESNLMDVNDAATYPDKMEALIRGWRTKWNDPAMPFYSVQIAPHFYHLLRRKVIVSPESLAEFWEAQVIAARRIPNTGLAATTDLVDDLFDIHPRNKLDVGQRLALLALARTYGRTDVVASGPVFKTWETREGKAVVTFDHATGLAAKDGKALSWFTLAGPDGRFHPATAAVIEGDRIILSHPKVARPTAVRFAWDEAAAPNLINAAGLPAYPFRTDAPISPAK